MTNYERYFGTPERAAYMSMEYVRDEEKNLNGTEIYSGTELVGIIWYTPWYDEHEAFRDMREAFLEWLQEECE